MDECAMTNAIVRGLMNAIIRCGPKTVIILINLIIDETLVLGDFQIRFTIA